MTNEFVEPDKVQNVYVKIGNPLTPIVKSTVTYQFQLVTFENTPVQISNKVDSLFIESCMKQSQKLIVFSTMGESSPNSSQYVINSVWQNELSKYPCGIITKNYTIIPQVVICQTGDYIDNILKKDDEGQSDEKKIQWETDDKYSHRTNLSSPKQFGIINTSNLNFFGDTVQLTNYYLNYETSVQKGSFAFMFEIQGSLQMKKDMENPGIEIDINGNGQNIIFLSKSSQVIVQISGRESETGSVTSSTVGFNVPHIKNAIKMQPITIFVYPIYNSLVVSSNLSGSILQKNGVVARISDNTLNAIAVMKPSLSEFPGEYMKSGSQSISVNGKNFQFSDKLGLIWKNCYGSFCMCPITFAEQVYFSFYFVGQLKNSSVDGVTVSYKAIPIFCNNGSSYSMENEVNGKQQIVENDDMKTIWRFDFSIVGNGGMSSNVGQMFGFIKVQKKSGTPSEIINKDGKYSQNYNRDFLLNKIGCPTKIFAGTDDGWSEYITNVQLQIGIDGTSGSITLDKYAMKSNLSELPQQNIGAITLLAFGGAYKDFMGNNLYGGQEGLIFKGYALQTSNSVSESSATMNVTLVGVQKKLEDIKMINAPFWDGDRLFGSSQSSVMSYFRSYTACYLQQVSSFLPKGNNYILPRSDNYQKPAVNFTTGTSCLQALRTASQMCDVKMVVQPNGKVYFYETDEQFLPYYIKNSQVVKKFDENQIISYDISPSLQNRYNSFATMGFLTTSTPSTQFDPTKVGTIPGILLDSEPPRNGFDFPWSRIISQVIPGWLTADQLEAQHKINKKRGKAQIWQGSVTVAGIANLYLYDKIKIGDYTYFITGISQNIDLQNKTWTTSLNIARYYS